LAPQACDSVRLIAAIATSPGFAPKRPAANLSPSASRNASQNANNLRKNFNNFLFCNVLALKGALKNARTRRIFRAKRHNPYVQIRKNIVKSLDLFSRNC
jgi:hypothetical protein